MHQMQQLICLLIIMVNNGIFLSSRVIIPLLNKHQIYQSYITRFTEGSYVALIFLPLKYLAEEACIGIQVRADRVSDVRKFFKRS